MAINPHTARLSRFRLTQPSSADNQVLPLGAKQSSSFFELCRVLATHTSTAFPSCPPRRLAEPDGLAASAQWALVTSTKARNATALLANTVFHRSVRLGLLAVNRYDGLSTRCRHCPISPILPPSPSTFLPPALPRKARTLMIRQFTDLHRPKEWNWVEMVPFEETPSSGSQPIHCFGWRVDCLKVDTLTHHKSCEGFAHMIVCDGKGDHLAGLTITDAGALGVIKAASSTATRHTRARPLHNIVSTGPRPSSGVPVPVGQ